MMKRNLTAKFMVLLLCSITLLNTAALNGCKKEELTPGVTLHVTDETVPEDAGSVTNVYRSDFLSFPENYNPAPATCLILTADCICRAGK